MPKAHVEEYADELVPEDTLVRARLESVVEKPISWVDKQTGEQREKQLWQWTWRVVDGDFQGLEVPGDTDAKLSSHDNNRPRRWAEALLGRELTVGEQFNTDDVVGLQADITVRHRQSKTSDRVFMDVDEVLPVGAPTTQPPF